MKNVKILSLSFAMLLCFIANAQEKIVSDSISKKQEYTFTKTEVTIPTVNISHNFVKVESASTFRIVCGKTISNKTEPLYVVDGTLINSKQFSTVNPNDIDNIKILKGVEATALYGSQAVNGVVIMTTKREYEKNTEQ